MFGGCMSKGSQIAYIEEDPSLQPLNMRSIDMFRQDPRNPERRLLNPGDKVALDAKGSSFRQFNPIFSQEQLSFAAAGGVGSGNGEISRHVVQNRAQRPELSFSDDSRSPSGGSSDGKLKDGSENADGASSGDNSSSGDNINSGSASGGSGSVVHETASGADSLRGSGTQPVHASQESPRSSSVESANPLLSSSNISSTAPTPVGAKTNIVRENNELALSGDEQHEPNSYDLAVAISNMQYQVQNFDTICCSKRFQNVIADLEQRSQGAERSRGSGAPSLEPAANPDALAAAHSTGLPEAGLAPAADSAGAGASNETGRYSVPTDVEKLLELYNVQQPPQSQLPPPPPQKSSVIDIMRPLNQELSQLPNKSKISPQLKSKMLEIKQQHNNIDESSEEEITVQRLTPEFEQKPIFFEEDLEDENEIDKIELIENMIKQQLEEIVNHQNVTFTLSKTLSLNQKSVKFIRQFALRLCNCFSTEICTFTSIIQQIAELPRRCTNIENKAIDAGENFFLLLEHQRLQEEINYENIQMASQPLLVNEQEKDDIELKQELKELTVVNIDKLWNLQ